MGKVVNGMYLDYNSTKCLFHTLLLMLFSYCNIHNNFNVIIITYDQTKEHVFKEVHTLRTVEYLYKCMHVRISDTSVCHTLFSKSQGLL